MTLSPVFGLNILASRLPGLLKKLQPLPTSIVSIVDRGAAPVIGVELESALQRSGVRFRTLNWTPGEKRKSLQELEKLSQRLLRAGLDRNGLVLGVGGGITTDMAGFAASTYMRGVRWAALPTTLLGMSDAAIGGKTAVNLPEGKNLVGRFHMPEFVLADVSSLATLPEREWSCGLGEVVKSGMIASPSLLSRLEKTSPKDLRKAGPSSLALARAAAKVKCRIVEEDPLEQGRRKLLNLGHTFGHALETAAGPRRLAHGEAVALGMRCALDYAVDHGLAKPAYRSRMLALLDHAGLCAKFPGRLPPVKELTRLIARDKKKANRRVDVILPVQAGQCVIVAGKAPKELAQRIHDSLD